MKAGPEPVMAVHASKCFSSSERTRPPAEKMALTRVEMVGSEMGVRTVIPSRTCGC
jgi:hypothetical protein